MAFRDMFGKAKRLADQNAEKIEGGLDKASEAIKKKAPDKYDGYVDKANDAAKGAIGRDEPGGAATPPASSSGGPA